MFPSQDPDPPYAGSWLTLPELARVFGVSYQAVYSRIRRRQVPTMRRARRGKPLILARPGDFPIFATRRRKGK